MKAVVLAFISTLVSVSAMAEVWPVEHQWNQAAEDSYSKWVETEWTQDVFKHGPLEGLETDCADATYSMRALYAFNNHLPFQVTTSDGKILSQKSSLFDEQSSGLGRFRAFLRHVYDETNTKTLAYDTYPIAMNRQSIRAGTIYLATGEHSYQVIRLSEQGVPVLLNSTTPSQNRILFQMLSFPFYRPQTKDASDGYRAFRWPSEQGLPVHKIARANFDQFAIAGNVLQFAEVAKKKLALKEESLAQQIDRQLTNICYFARERGFAVVNAYLALTEKRNSCFTPSERDLYSTEIRDQRLEDYFKMLRSLREDPRWSELDKAHKKILMTVFVEDISLEASSDVGQIDQTCRIQTGIPTPADLSLYEVWRATRDKQLSQDPTVSIRARWGLEPAVSMCRR